MKYLFLLTFLTGSLWIPFSQAKENVKCQALCVVQGEKNGRGSLKGFETTVVAASGETAQIAMGKLFKQCQLFTSFLVHKEFYAQEMRLMAMPGEGGDEGLINVGLFYRNSPEANSENSCQ